MIRRTLALLGLALILCSCVKDEPAKARTTWAGIFTLKASSNKDVFPEWNKVKRTKKIPSILGTRFGIEYRLDDSAFEPLIPYRFVWRYPPQGQINPATNMKATYYQYEDFCINGRICQASYRFDYDWEMVPGTWYAEVWIDDKRVMQKAFEIQGDKPQVHSMPPNVNSR